MRHHIRLSAVGGLILLSCILCAGCMSTGGGLPTGKWAGDGAYCAIQAESDVPATQPAYTREISYPTMLEITEAEHHGQTMYAVQIFSKHQKQTEDMDNIRLNFFLMPVGKIEGDAQFVSLLAAEVEAEGKATGMKDLTDFRKPSEQEVEQALKRKDLPRATLLRKPGRTVLQIQYNEAGDMPFTDTFVFEFGRVLKTGYLSESGRIAWIEELRPTF